MYNAKNIIYDYNKMKKINNSKKRENRKILLTMFEFSTLQEARKSLSMKNEKADVVYEQLRTNYNEQIDEIRANLQKARNKKTYDINKDIKRVNSFNENGKELTIKNIDPRKLKRIIASIDTTKRTILTIPVGTIEKHYTLTPEKQANYLKNEDMFFVQEGDNNSSDAEMIYKIISIKQVTIGRPKWLGKSKNEGAFFKYYHNTSFNLDEFAVHREKQEKYNENCFVQALVSLSIDDSIITEVRKIICSKYLPTNKLTAIADKFNLYIRVKTLDAHKDINFGKKGNQQILLGLIDQHISQ